MSLANQLPSPDRWQFLQHPEKDFLEIAALINRISADDVERDNTGLLRLMAFIKQHVGLLFGTIVEIKAAMAMAGDQDVRRPGPDCYVLADIRGSGELTDFVITNELAIQNGGILAIGNRADIFLEFGSNDLGDLHNQRVWVPSLHIDDLHFYDVRHVELN